eukprot:CCRYP_019702-RA/>CCRYP_019702-RA protein AED:0.38 eAED:0.38 QI:191/1/1/1/1/1/2/226/325
MPQANPPGAKKKKKGRAPKHQNTFAFRHNPKSKKTEKILSSPNVGVCRRCHDKIEWRKKYRKYKPRTQPGKCNICFQKNVMAAYHTICTKCAGGDVAIAAMEKYQSGPKDETTKEEEEEEGMDGDLTVSNNNVDDVTRDENKDDPSVSNDCPQSTTDISTSKGESNTSIIKPQTNSRKIRVCAMCTHEPALSKYDNLEGEGVDELITQIQELEDTLESGIDATDGHKLTLREVKGVERQLDKLRLEIKEKGKKNKKKVTETEAGEVGESESDNEGDSDDDDSEQSDEDNDDPNDPFLLAVGGKDKLLVGEEYQKMLLAKEQQKKG